MRRADRDVVIEVMSRNRAAFRVFMACQTQWRTAGFGELAGLDYTALLAVMQMKRIKNHSATFDRVRVIESAALQEIARRRSATKPKRSTR